MELLANIGADTSWVNEKAKDDLKYFEYKDYGESHERFFDDGTDYFPLNLKKLFKNSK